MSKTTTAERVHTAMDGRTHAFHTVNGEHDLDSLCHAYDPEAAITYPSDGSDIYRWNFTDGSAIVVWPGDCWDLPLSDAPGCVCPATWSEHYEGCPARRQLVCEEGP